MSVLVEALSLIVPRKVLDVSYPGGTKAFLQKMNVTPAPCRCSCSDEKLVSVSFFGVEDATVVGTELLSHGIVALDDDRFYELAYIDQADGPTMPCDWIEWEKHDEGYTSCWLAGVDPGEFQAPDNWTPQQSRNMVFHDIRSEPDRCMKLAAEPDGHEVWIDFQTGDIAPGVPYRPERESSPPSSQPEEPDLPASEGDVRDAQSSMAEGTLLIASIRAMLDARSYSYTQVDEETVALSQLAEHGAYVAYLTARDATDFVGLCSSHGSRIPESRRAAIAEALSRINTRLWLGHFELDFADGELRFRISMDVEDGTLSAKMLDNMLACSLSTMERFHVPLMRIAFGGVEPELALARTE